MGLRIKSGHYDGEVLALELANSPLRLNLFPSESCLEPLHSLQQLINAEVVLSQRDGKFFCAITINPVFGHPFKLDDLLCSFSHDVTRFGDASSEVAASMVRGMEECLTFIKGRAI